MLINITMKKRTPLKLSDFLNKISPLNILIITFALALLLTYLGFELGRSYAALTHIGQ
ncbi:hypothetical protein [Aquimarina hainanensis]|uniref:hypothetical protein n=1 Tax=Aquimarina hainanensis TaxID=1578017 RepID=UPI0036092727